MLLGGYGVIVSTVDSFISSTQLVSELANEPVFLAIVCKPKIKLFGLSLSFHMVMDT